MSALLAVDSGKLPASSRLARASSASLGPLGDELAHQLAHQFEGRLAQFGAGLHVDHERPGDLHGGEGRVDAVGQAALLAHFLHQPGAEAAAAEDLVADVERGVVRVAALDAELGEHQVGLLGGELDVLALRGRRLWRGRRRQRRAAGQGGGELRGDGLGLAAREVADQGDHRVAGGVGAGVEGAQLRLLQGRNAALGAVAGRGVGVLAVELAEQRPAGQLAGVLLLLFEAGEDLVLEPAPGRRPGSSARRPPGRTAPAPASAARRPTGCAARRPPCRGRRRCRSARRGPRSRRRWRWRPGRRRPR